MTQDIGHDSHSAKAKNAHGTFSLALTLLLVSACAQAGDWPQHFLHVAGAHQTQVMLDRDGRAAYTTRTRTDGRADHATACSVTWRWCEPPVESELGKCLHLDVEGHDSGEGEVSFTFDYWYSPTALIRFDKTGSQETLPRLDNN